MLDSTLKNHSPVDLARIREQRRFPIGAECISDSEVHFRVWAPEASRVDVVFPRDDRSETLSAEEAGYFSGIASARAGEDYRFRLNGRPQLYPDPASRFQPDGPHGVSRIVNPATFAWHDSGWRGVTLEGQVLYELHVGTFTADGTWSAAANELAALADLGITTIEVMPIAEFDGRFGWGYDGVDLYAPFHFYGDPDDVRGFVDRAHALGIGVLLDVVYNHLGPVGNYLRAFSTSYFTDRYENEWGDAINFDGEDSGPVREFFIANAMYWIDEFHFDGLRLDATQQIFDTSAEHILTAIGRQARAAARRRSIILVAENEPQTTRLVSPVAEGGYGLDALWNDDFHHCAMVALTGRAEAYYSDTRGQPQEFISAAKYGYLFQGQHYHWQHRPRGTPGLDLEPARFVIFLQNHDQVANSARGLRGHQLTSPAKWRAMTALLLLMPGTPMLFQGEEFDASAPFLYFADFDEELAEAVRKGRAEFLTQFPSIEHFQMHDGLALPGAPSTFELCKLDRRERVTNASAYRLHHDLLRLRRHTPAFRLQARGGVDGAVLSSDAFVLRYFTDGGVDDRLILVNLGRDLDRGSFAEPLIAPPDGRDWCVEWSSDDPAYGGNGTPNLWPEGRWHIRGESTYVLAPTVRRLKMLPNIQRRTA